jgi:hypothetical protein
MLLSIFASTRQLLFNLYPCLIENQGEVGSDYTLSSPEEGVTAKEDCLALLGTAPVRQLQEKYFLV